MFEIEEHFTCAIRIQQEEIDEETLYIQHPATEGHLVLRRIGTCYLLPVQPIDSCYQNDLMRALISHTF